MDRDTLANMTDTLRRKTRVLDKAWEPLTYIIGDLERGDLGALQALLPAIEKFEAASEQWLATGASAVVEHAQALLSLCDNPAYLDERDQIRTEEVSKALAALLGSFPTSNIPQPTVFTLAMLDDVLSEQPSWLALESACRHLRRTQKFMPSITEVLAVLKDEQERWDSREAAVWDARFYLTAAPQLIAEAKMQLASLQLTEAATPIVEPVVTVAPAMVKDEF